MLLDTLCRLKGHIQQRSKSLGERVYAKRQVKLFKKKKAQEMKKQVIQKEMSAGSSPHENVVSHFSSKEIQNIR